MSRNIYHARCSSTSMPHMDGDRDAATYPRDRRGYSGHRRFRVCVGGLGRDLLKHGACDFFQKPVDLLRLQETVERLRTLREI